MKYKSLDGRSVTINFNDFTLIRERVSSGHLRARKILKELFPADRIYEEVTLPVTSRQNLFADFFIPTRRIIVEVHGEQHFSKNDFFHKTHQDFNRSKARDNLKRSWCEENEITLITLRDKDTDDVWREKVSKRETE